MKMLDQIIKDSPSLAQVINMESQQSGFLEVETGCEADAQNLHCLVLE